MTQHSTLFATRKSSAIYKLEASCRLLFVGSIRVCIFILLTFSTLTYAQICQTDSFTATTPNNRFQILANGSEVKDKKTGLIWQRCSFGQIWSNTANNGNGGCMGTATQHNWLEALNKVRTLGNGYRLPNIKELNSIVERKCYRPSINQKIFPNMPRVGLYYWSSSPSVNNKAFVWIVRFYRGYSVYGGHKHDKMHFRAVRSPKSSPK